MTKNEVETRYYLESLPNLQICNQNKHSCSSPLSFGVIGYAAKIIGGEMTVLCASVCMKCFAYKVVV